LPAVGSGRLAADARAASSGGIGRIFPQVGHRPRFPPASSGACNMPPQLEQDTLIGMTPSGAE
jgi:hypothetical protein